MKTIIRKGLFALCVSGVLVANAQAAEATSEKHAEAAVKYRQSLLQLVKSNIRPLGGMAKGAIPFDTEVMAKNSLRLEQLADMMEDYLLVDTRAYDVETGALDSLFENEADVKDKISAMQKAVANLRAVVEAGDESAYRSAIGDVGASCKSCHDKYLKD